MQIQTTCGSNFITPASMISGAERKPGWKGVMTGKRADDILENQPVGTWLTRLENGKFFFSLKVRDQIFNAVDHHEIRWNLLEKCFCNWGPSHKGSTPEAVMHIKIMEAGLIGVARHLS